MVEIDCARHNIIDVSSVQDPAGMNPKLLLGFISDRKSTEKRLVNSFAKPRASTTAVERIESRIFADIGANVGCCWHKSIILRLAEHGVVDWWTVVQR